MARDFKEVAFFRTDLDKYKEGYDRIYGKNKEEKVNTKSGDGYETNLHNARLLTSGDYILTHDYIKEVLLPSMNHAEMIEIIARIDWGVEELEEYIFSSENFKKNVLDDGII